MLMLHVFSFTLMLASVWGQASRTGSVWYSLLSCLWRDCMSRVSLFLLVEVVLYSSIFCKYPYNNQSDGSVNINGEVQALNARLEEAPNNQLHILMIIPETSSQRSQVSLPERVTGPHAGSFKLIELTTNHYQVNLKPFDKIVIFRTKITPIIPPDNRNLRTELLRKIEPELRAMIQQPVISGFTIYSHKEGLKKEENFKCKEFIINVKQVKIYDVATNPKLLLTFLNNGLQNVMEKINYTEIGRSGKYFSCKGEKKQIDNLSMYSGFKANFVHLQSGYFLRVDSVKKIVRNETVLDYIDGLYKMHEGKDREEKRQAIKEDLINKIVMTNYGKMQYYKIKDIQFKKAQEVILQDNRSMLDYFLEKYRVQIKHPAQPLLEVETKRFRNNQGPVLIFPELCLMTGIPDNFDEIRRKKISESTINSPTEKMNQIQGLMKEIKDTDQINALRALGMEVKPTVSKVQAKIIPIPRLQLGGRNSVQSGKQAFFNLFNKPIFHSKHSVNLAVIFFHGTDITMILDTFSKTSHNLGVSMNTKTYKLNGKSARDMEKQMKEQPSGSNGTNICLLVLPGNMKNQYKKLKRYAIEELQMLTQVVTETTLRKKNLQSIATKVLLQIIAKRGNTLWVPQTTQPIKDCMLVGFDSAKSGSSIYLTATSTVNSTYSSLHTHFKKLAQADGKFLAMVELTCDCIAAYHERNRRLPKEVLIFLNSCTGDQVSIYHEHYLGRLTEQLKKAYSEQASLIALTAIMVNVKNSERFFTQDGTFRNVPAGTLVSEGMVSNFYDFFLVSQQTGRGSTVPNHYRVIYCNSKMEEGLLQELIFSQCFNYVNWTGSIKVPAILQYAKKSAKFSSEVFDKGIVSRDMQNKPYYV